MSKCYLCNSNCGIGEKSGATDLYYCPHCGAYGITYELLSVFDKEYKEKKYIISGFLNEFNSNKEECPYMLTTESVRLILCDVRIPKTTMQKLEKFLLFCYKKNEIIGEKFTTNPAYVNKTIGRSWVCLFNDNMQDNISYIKKADVKGAIMALSEIGLVKIKLARDGEAILCFSLTAKGLEYAEKISTTNMKSNKVFVAIEYHGDYKERMDAVIIPACKACGFEAFIASDTQHNNSINDEMIVDIKRSRFVIADFTNNNLGAYYEAGYAKGIGSQVIKCCDKKWLDEKDENGKKNTLHFDVNHDKFIMYDGYDDFKKQLKSRIRATIPNAILED